MRDIEKVVRHIQSNTGDSNRKSARGCGITEGQ